MTTISVMKLALLSAIISLALAAPPGSPNQDPDDFLDIKLVTHEKCRADIHKLCGDDNSLSLNDKTSNLDVMGCLLDKQETEEALSVSDECNHVLWQFRHNITRSPKAVAAIGQFCPKQQFAECKDDMAQPGHYVSCVLDQLDNLEDEEGDDGCADFLENLAVMVFSDYRIIYKFAEDCAADIEQHQCGRLEQEDERIHSQGQTIECLSRHMDNLKDTCKLQVLRVAELQAEDYHMDRPLFFACREDRERFCASTQAGNGRIYTCLIEHKMEKQMSDRCRAQITRRQKMTSADYRVSKRLRKACKAELKESQCHQAGGVPKKDSESQHSIKLALVLLCLDDHQKQGHPVNGECMQEMIDHRRSLMEDYTLSPELVMGCMDDIQRLCLDESKTKNGLVIHCLMMHSNHAKMAEEQRISDQCQRQVEDLLRVADVAEDWKVDPVLQRACEPVVRDACSDVRGGGGAVLSCLAENLDTDAMTPECETVLHQIQYFVSRDFKLDPHLYKTCHEDAQRLCNAGAGWLRELDRPGASNDVMVLPCLYRNAYRDYHPDDPAAEKISDACRAAVRRVMKHRTDSVDLHPEVEEACMIDLAQRCSEQAAERGHEIVCLQDNYDNLKPKCQEVIKRLTEDEAQYVELNPIVAKVCKHAIKQNCMHQIESGGTGVMECLIEHKDDPSVRGATKCHAAITHFQIISLGDYTFSYKFKQNCKDAIDTFCHGKHNKPEVVGCVSAVMLNDTLSGQKHRVPKNCRHQVQSQLQQREENKKLDPRLTDACGADIIKLCKEESEHDGSGQVLECLREHVDELSPKCSKLLFRRQQQSLILPKADYYLFNACKGMILKYCSVPHESGAEVLACLKTQLDEPSFEPTCRKVVSQRLAEQKRDYRLHPSLRRACLPEARRHCAGLLRDERPDQALQGRVTACLEEALRRGQIGSADCAAQLTAVLQEAARDLRQDPVLAADCRREIGSLCAGTPADQTVECLRQRLADGARMSEPCAARVAAIVQNVNVDVHTDPQLSAACAFDLQLHCAHVPPGDGAQMACLTAVKDPKQKCADMITVRMKMMSAAMKVKPVQTVEELYTAVRDSPSRDYFAVLVFGVLVVMFFGGLCCGRATKRAKYIQKMK